MSKSAGVKSAAAGAKAVGAKSKSRSKAKVAVVKYKAAKSKASDTAHISFGVKVDAPSAVIEKAEAEAKRKFDAWMAKYEPVEREIHEKLRHRAESRRRRAKARRKAFGNLCEATEGMAAFCRRRGVSLAEGEMMLNGFRPAPYAAAFIGLCQIAWFGAILLRMELTRRIDRAKHEAMRPYYYKQEKMRRQALAVERRRILKRSTLNACPTREEILDAWEKVKDSNENLLRFGSLMEDLECYVDNSLLRDESGEIVGRRSGVKGWLQMEIPALYAVYSRVMAYKAAAKRMRQIIELRDPLPLSAVLDMGKVNQEKAALQDYGADEVYGRTDRGGKTSVKRNSTREVGENVEGYGRKGCGKSEMAPDGVDEVAVLRARAVYLEVVRPVGGGCRRQTALLDRMVKLTDPDYIEDRNMLEGWRAEYEHKITVRTKYLWSRRLWKMLA